MSIDVASHGIHPVAAALHRIPARQQIDDRLEKLPGEPLSGGDGETHLVCTLADVLGYATGHCFTKHELVPGAAHLPVVRQRKRELREPMIEKRQSGFDRMRHRIAIFETKIKRQRAVREAL